MTDEIMELYAQLRKTVGDDHSRRCEWRYHGCTCGYDEYKDATINRAADALERLAAENGALRHDIERHLAIVSELEARLQQAEHRVGFLEYQGRCREEMLVEKEAKLQEAVAHISGIAAQCHQHVTVRGEMVRCYGNRATPREQGMTDAKLLKFVTSFRSGIVGRGRSEYMCFAVCAPLVTLLNMNGVESAMREGVVKFEIGEINHFWIELADGRVLDPTADQFNHILLEKLPKVYLGAAVSRIHDPAKSLYAATLNEAPGKALHANK